MPRGNGKQAQTAKLEKSGLLAYVKGASNGDNGTAQEFVDYGEIDGRFLIGAVWAAVKMGGAIMFGCSRDKTCYSVRLYYGSEGKSYYFPCNPNGVVDMEGFLQGLINVADAGDE